MKETTTQTIQETQTTVKEPQTLKKLAKDALSMLYVYIPAMMILHVFGGGLTFSGYIGMFVGMYVYAEVAYYFCDPEDLYK